MRNFSVSCDKNGILASFGKWESFGLSIWNIQWGNWVSSVAGFRDLNNNIILYVPSILFFTSLVLTCLIFIYWPFYFFSSFKWSTLSERSQASQTERGTSFKSMQNGLHSMSVTWANPDTKAIRALRLSCATSVARIGRYTLTYRNTRILFRIQRRVVLYEDMKNYFCLSVQVVWMVETKARTWKHIARLFLLGKAENEMRLWSRPPHRGPLTWRTHLLNPLCLPSESSVDATPWQQKQNKMSKGLE